MKQNDKRFELVLKEWLTLGSSCQILVDKETGVNYLTWRDGYAGGITPLLDSDGKPVITKIK